MYNLNYVTYIKLYKASMALLKVHHVARNFHGPLVSQNFTVFDDI